MNQNYMRVIDPKAILREACLRWAQNFIAVIAIYGITIFLMRLLKYSRAMAGNIAFSWANFGLTLLFIVEVIVVLVLNCFVALTVINYFKAAVGSKPGFSSVFSETRRGIAGYLKAYFALLLFLLAVFIIASVFLIAGNIFYKGPGLASVKLTVLLGACTVFVVCILSGAWYGFFFTLAPLIGAFEGKGVWTCFRESRSRVRGNALHYLLIMLVFLVFYASVGLGLYFGVGYLSHHASLKIGRAVDLMMSAVFGPLALALWYVCYEKLTALKKFKT